MRKAFLFVCVLLLLASPCFAATTLLEDAVATGVGESTQVNQVKNHTVACYYTDANSSITALSVVLQGTIDNTNWYDLATHSFSAAELSAKGAMFHVIDKTVSRVRANITVLTGWGAGDVVNVLYVGVR